MDNQKNNPQIRFATYSDEWVQQKMLDCIAKITDFRGRTPKKLGMDWSESGYLAFSALNVKDGYIDFSQDVHYGNQELYDKWMGGNELHQGQVLFTTEAPMGNVAQVPDNNKYILSQRVIAFTPKETLISEKFLATVLRSAPVFSKLTSLSSGGTAKGVSQKALSNVELFFPSNPKEQNQIALLFAKLDELIANSQDKYDKLCVLKDTMIGQLFPKADTTTPSVRFDGFTAPWIRRHASELFTEFSDRGFPELPVLSATQSSGMVIRDELGKNISHELANEVGYKRVLPGQFVIHLRSFQGGFAHSDIEGITSPAYTVFGFAEPQMHCHYFWKYVFSSKSFIRRLESVTYGIRDGRSISYEEFLALDFLCPSKKEQEKIAQFMLSLDSLIFLHKKEKDKLQTLRKTLFEKMFV